MADDGQHEVRSGGFRNLKSFQTARLVYDLTIVFCDMYVSLRSRTHDQMVQAARSGVQNIAEGSVASRTSKMTEIKLTGVALASLHELQLDFEDFLRHRGLSIWVKDSIESTATRDRLKRGEPIDIRTLTVEVAANTIRCLIFQASYLLGRQLEALEAAYVKGGDHSERLSKARRNYRKHMK